MSQAIAEYESPATLVAILVCAHRAGDRDLQRLVKARLQDQHNLRIIFGRAAPQPTELGKAVPFA